MASGNDLIDAVATALNRDDLLSTGTDKAVSQRALNDTLRDLVLRYPFSWRVSVTPLAVATVVNQTVYDLTTTGVQEIFAVVLDTGASDTRWLAEISVERYTQEWAAVDFLAGQKPSVYARVGQQSIKVAPRPSGIWTLRVYYSLEFADITDFTASITQLPSRGFEVVKWGMQARLLLHTHEWEAATQIEARYERGMQRLITEDKAAPNLGFLMQPAVFGARPIGVDYWKVPTIYSVP